MWESQGEVQHVVEHAYKTESPICKIMVLKKKRRTKIQQTKTKNITTKKPNSLLVILVSILQLKNFFHVKVLQHLNIELGFFWWGLGLVLICFCWWVLFFFKQKLTYWKAPRKPLCFSESSKAGLLHRAGSQVWQQGDQAGPLPARGWSHSKVSRAGPMTVTR